MASRCLCKAGNVGYDAIQMEIDVKQKEIDRIKYLPTDRTSSPMVRLRTGGSLKDEVL